MLAQFDNPSHLFLAGIADADGEPFDGRFHLFQSRGQLTTLFAHRLGAQAGFASTRLCIGQGFGGGLGARRALRPAHFGIGKFGLSRRQLARGVHAGDQHLQVADAFQGLFQRRLHGVVFGLQLHHALLHRRGGGPSEVEVVH